MANSDKAKNEHEIKNQPQEKPKNLLDCNIACVAKKSRFKPQIKRVRLRANSIFPVELPEYQGQNYVKKYICPKCMSNLEITVKSEKAGLLFYKLVIIGYLLVFVVANAILLQNQDSESFMNIVIETNAILLAVMVILIFYKAISNYFKTRSIRSIRLKIRAEYGSMSHQLNKAKRTKYKPKNVRN